MCCHLGNYENSGEANSYEEATGDGETHRGKAEAELKNVKSLTQLLFFHQDFFTDIHICASSMTFFNSGQKQRRAREFGNWSKRSPTNTWKL